MNINKDTIQYINFFEKLTKAKVKNCFANNILTFVVNFGEMGKAIGKKGVNVKKIANLTKKKIKIVEFNPNPSIFIKNMIYPLKASEIKQDNTTIEIQADTKTKGLLIGRNQKNLKDLKEIFNHYFKDIQIKI
ncbi:MAG: NusA-like transcription termination signal-binding factor [Nanoarchaeota archaeon]|nr:NusA-like transcription termination signal-binding factor [Nanoarchaeota archaeon]